MNAEREPFIETFTGRRFQPLNPCPEDVCIEDIAHALSQQCRFSGHSREPYSVAEHSVRVARLLDSWGVDRSVVFWGLLHDASEAYLVDLPTPLKASPAFAPYRAAETRLQRVILERFGLCALEPEAVRSADRVLLATEVRDLMPGAPAHWGGLASPLPHRIDPLTPARAEAVFLQTFKDLT